MDLQLLFGSLGSKTDILFTSSATVMLVPDMDAADQALRPGVQKSQDGSFRATFEDKPLMSDIIFLRAWIGVDLPKFYNPVTNLLAPPVKPLARELKPGHMASEVSLSQRCRAMQCCVNCICRYFCMTWGLK